MSEDLRAPSFNRLPVYRPQSGTPADTASPVRADTPPQSQPHIARNPPLARLCDALDAIFDACAHFPEPSDSTFFARSMRIALAQAAAEPALLAPPQREGSTQTYRRHLLAADPQGRYA